MHVARPAREWNLGHVVTRALPRKPEFRDRTPEDPHGGHAEGGAQVENRGVVRDDRARVCRDRHDLAERPFYDLRVPRRGKYVPELRRRAVLGRRGVPDLKPQIAPDPLAEGGEVPRRPPLRFPFRADSENDKSRLDRSSPDPL